MATGDLVTGSDGELAIKVGPWAKEKLIYIKGLCDIFNVGMKNLWPTRAYVDLFAGPGTCVVEKTGEEIPGSPIIALSCKTPFTHYFFNDIKPELTWALESRVASCSSANVEFLSEDCNSAVDVLLTKLPPDSLDFCFIDPLNWEINFNSIRKLTQNRKMDLAITFHIGSIKRTAGNPPQELIDFFPDLNWKQEYEKVRAKGKSTGRVLLDAYEGGLRNIGYGEIRDYVLEKNQKGVPLYHLIFASKHPRGADFWEKITTRLGTGQIRMQLQHGETS